MERFTNMMWPQGNPRVSEAIHSYAKQIVELDQLLRRMILESMVVERANTDMNLVTILSKNQVQGLEITTKDGQA
ncbi:hypothetical protein IFM89_022754 [Coptis chinensis]|uniref:Uncharacterized protein n=1 Tax=Coptis chinensis TaxID=261450 RepID=A0A835HF03_9MAGN|nr:hypothetical protein IFM89_022754 [Coptis chinensis]